MACSSFFWSLFLGVLGGEGIPYSNTLLRQMCLETMQPKLKNVFPLQAKYGCSVPSIRPAFDGHRLRDCPVTKRKAVSFLLLLT